MLACTGGCLCGRCHAARDAIERRSFGEGCSPDAVVRNCQSNSHMGQLSPEVHLYFQSWHCRWMCGRWVSCCTRCCLGADPLGRGAARRRFCATRSCSRPSMSPSLQSLPSLQSARTSSRGELTTPRTVTVTAFRPAQSLCKARCKRLTLLGGTQPRGNPAQLGHTEGKGRHTPSKSCYSCRVQGFHRALRWQYPRHWHFFFVFVPTLSPLKAMWRMHDHSFTEKAEKLGYWYIHN